MIKGVHRHVSLWAYVHRGQEEWENIFELTPTTLATESRWWDIFFWLTCIHNAGAPLPLPAPKKRPTPPPRTPAAYSHLCLQFILCKLGCLSNPALQLLFSDRPVWPPSSGLIYCLFFTLSPHIMGKKVLQRQPSSLLSA